MVDPIDIPDNLSKTHLPDKLKPVVRSNPERERNGFSKALKDKMEEELEEKSKKRRDTVEIEYQNQEEPNQDRKHETPKDDSNCESDESGSDKAPLDHVDLKA